MEKRDTAFDMTLAISLGILFVVSAAAGAAGWWNNPRTARPSEPKVELSQTKKKPASPKEAPSGPSVLDLYKWGAIPNMGRF